MRSLLLALGRRFGRVAVTLWVVFTGVFVALAYVPNPHTATVAYQPRLFRGIHREPRFAAQSEPLVAQYADWLVRIVTLDLGRIGFGDEAVVVREVVAEAVTVTLIHLVPAMLLAIVLGTLIQLLAVAVEYGDASATSKLVGAAAISIPVFLVAYLLQIYLPGFVIETSGQITDLGYDESTGPFSRANLEAAVWPSVTMGLYLFAIQFRAAGADLEQYADEAFVKTARAKGVGLLGICRHVFPHSAARLLTVLTSEMLGMVLVGLYAVEWVTRTPGFGALTIDAAGSRGPGLIFAAVLLPVLVVTVVNTARETYYSLFDPRVETGD
ncbi:MULTISPECIES: ABC transporter permease subunit [Halolamina]|uniref:Peptide/nickel transport system permease protein n=1 Tax=Halolamina pelagica TaxID=699431 RepID=A0A1I5NGW0_9EURY|nr:MULTISPECIES: ABC transporter permease subunit [Halolamina]NHX36308.1 ABC transporter permease subunit [Halolamina sp. R1-12]SFP21048.1 peptide/nickel transport system permease protein [Halolamina pelagica]